MTTHTIRQPHESRVPVAIGPDLARGISNRVREPVYLQEISTKREEMLTECCLPQRRVIRNPMGDAILRDKLSLLKYC